MKRLLALLLCVTLFLPVLAAGEEEDIDFSELIEEDVELDEEGNIIFSGDDEGDYSFSDQDLEEMAEAFEIVRMIEK